MNYDEAAQKVVQYIGTATGDCADEYVGLLERKEIGGYGVRKEMYLAWRRAKDRAPTYFDNHGWVADYLFDDPDFCADMAGDHIYDVLPEFNKDDYNKVVDELIKQLPHAKDALLGLKQ